MEKTIDYLEKHSGRFKDELFDLLRIPSVSADPKHRQDMRHCAEALGRYLEEAGATGVEICPTEGHPVVYAERIFDPALPTVIVYGHYDVQPPDPLERWESAPFEPEVRTTAIHPGGAVFARGACDDKGQLFMHIKAFEAMVKTNTLPCNMRFMLEGEEEIGSAHLESFARSMKEHLKGDIILVSDTSMIANDVPAITVGLRGLSYLQIRISGPNRDLHSGIYGGAVANPLNVLSGIIAKMHDDKGRIAIPGFYDDVVELSVRERQMMAEAPFDVQRYKDDLEVGALAGEQDYTPPERVSIRPSLDVNGMWGGYTGDGAKTVLPSHATAKISMRLVPNQDPEKITQLVSKWIEANTPASVRVEVLPMHGGHPAVTPIDSVAYRAAEKAMEITFGKKPVPVRSGGSIPIVAMFEQVLGMKTLLMGFGLNSDDIHSPNEHYGLYNFEQGTKTIPWFHYYYSVFIKNQ